MHARAWLSLSLSVSRSLSLSLLVSFFGGSMSQEFFERSADTQACLPNVSCRVRRLGEAIVQKRVRLLQIQADCEVWKLLVCCPDPGPNLNFICSQRRG